ncbi:VOC family protein [Paracoccus sp. p3-h83]|uniref:VOC family protein n=1 Tax=Paracoccus sp. p3-h83 TaxID=3342805 RepID=UPI0035BB73B1
MRLDHVAVAAASLAEGMAWVEAALGVTLAPGGQHGVMGTHNRLLSLGPGEYLEVIAIDPAAPPPGRARWFGLDGFSGAPRLAGWVAACDDLDARLAASGAGRAVEVSRGDLCWRIGVSDSGVMPFDGCHPALIDWLGGPHPAARLPDAGCRLAALEVSHPRADDLALGLGLADPRIRVTPGPAGLRAAIDTPNGLVWL